MTSFYAWRQFLLTFHGRYRGADHADYHDEQPDEPPSMDGAYGADTGHDDAHHHAPQLSQVHESPLVMLVPLAVLALGAVLAGAAFNHFFVGEGAHEFWRASLVLTGHGEHQLPLWVEFGPLAVTIIGFLIAWYFYILHPEIAAAMQARQGLLYLFLYNKWYFDELYDFLFVRPALRLGRFLWKRGDGTVIDGLGPDGIAARVLDATRGAVRLQTGYVYHYALAMLLGVVALATWFMAGGLK
jgi:NADH-quinone oxidoreductase subunit L